MVYIAINPALRCVMHIVIIHQKIRPPSIEIIAEGGILQLEARGPMGCKIPVEANFEVRGWRIFQFILSRGSVLTFFSREGGMGNYTPNGWEVLTEFNPIHYGSGKRMHGIYKYE